MTPVRGRCSSRRSVLLVAAVAATFALPAGAGAQDAASFRHTGSFFVPQNLPDGADPLTPTSAEIAAISPDGTTLVYTDALLGGLGFVDLTDPAAPSPAGTLELPGSPTSLAFAGDRILAAVATNEDPDGDGPLNAYDAPSGELLVIDPETRETLRSIELAGQPDSVAVAPSGAYAAIVIENERDEEEADGLIPQAPAGVLQILDLAGEPDAWALRTVDLVGLAEVAADDPEPEFVDINAADQAVVSLQENNHLVVVDLASGEVVDHYSAGAVDLDGIDATEEELGPQGQGLIELTDALSDRRREPDAVAWLDETRFATANEGDYTDADGNEGGTRGFTIFDVEGNVLFDAGTSLEDALIRAGHFPQGRAENKGVEPEGLEVGVVDGRTLLFVGAERANAVAVYDVTDPSADPELLQVLPTGIGPEGIVATTDGLLAVTSEVDGPADEFAVRALITLYQAGAGGDWRYPMLVSADDANGRPIPWVAMSGLAGDPTDPMTVWAVSDSYLAQPALYRIDVSSTPAVITERIAVGGVGVEDQLTGDYDLEGVAVRPEGGFWLASEGRVADEGSRPNLIIRTDASGAVQEAFGLPEAITAGATSSGFEGVAVTGTAEGGDEAVWVAIQREWEDDTAGVVKLGRYDVAAGTWSFAGYPLETPTSPAGGWVGLSEITALPDGRLLIVERDNQLGQEATIKHLTSVDPSSVTWVAAGEPLPVLEKTVVRDVLPALDAASISVPDKLEGVAVTADGQVWLATDNDGVDENYGETVFLSLGSLESLGG
jgi:hypothetical protein